MIDDYEKDGRMKQITVRGEAFKCVKDAWLKLSPKGLTYNAVTNRMQRGWVAQRAVLVPPDHNSKMRRGVPGVWLTTIAEEGDS